MTAQKAAAIETLNWQNVCEVSDLVAGGGICALLGREQVAIFYEPADAQLYAISNFDPLGGAAVLSRGILGSLGARTVVASPLFKHHFDLETGECVEEPAHSLRVFPVRAVDSLVQVAIDPEPGPIPVD
ncbi:MAG: nitrite reductase small subunit NirD [Pseudomonadota bacterium]